MNVSVFGRAAAAAALCLTAASASAQAWNYPSMMTPTIVARQYGFVLANGGDAGTAIVGQWREGLNTETEFQLEVGFADPDGMDARFLLGASLARRLTRSSRPRRLESAWPPPWHAASPPRCTSRRSALTVDHPTCSARRCHPRPGSWS